MFKFAMILNALVFATGVYAYTTYDPIESTLLRITIEEAMQ